MHFLIAGAEGEGLLFRPTLLPLLARNGTPFVGDIMTEKELTELRASRRPTKLNLIQNGDMRVEAWEIATSLRGISPRADAVLLGRSYTDLEVRAETDILLREDRNQAWELILQWRKTAVEHLKHQFHLWLHVEKTVYSLRPYPLVSEPSGRIIVDDSEIEGEGSGAAGPSRSEGGKRGSRDLSPRKTPSKRTQFSASGFWSWEKKR